MAVHQDLSHPTNRLELARGLEAIRDLADGLLRDLNASAGPKLKERTRKQPANPKDSILGIVNKIKNCDESDRIEAKILNKTSIPGRVLMPFYICYKYFPDQSLTTGDIEKITGELRVRVKTPNVSNAIAGPLRKFLFGDSIRAKGKAVRYKLSRKGATHFEGLIKGNEQA